MKQGTPSDPPRSGAAEDPRIERLTRLVTMLAIMLGVALLAIGILFWSSLRG